jgi:hypothetical protein
MELTDNQLIHSVIKMQEELVSALAEISRLSSDMTKNQQSIVTVKQFIPSSEDEREQVIRSLFNLQRSGMTNMMASDDYIQRRFGFTKEKSQDYLFYYIDNYPELEEKYSKRNGDSVDTSSVSTAGNKKRKGPKPYAEMTPEELAEAKIRAAARVRANAENLEEATPVVQSPVVEVPVVARKKTIIRLKKPDAQEPKPKGVLIWNAFMNTVKLEMMQGNNGEEPSYNTVMKKAQELKEADPISYKLFTDNWAN